MRIVQITPGTGNFYCGSCLRDNALVRGLRARGHDAVLVPMYLPVVTEDSLPAEPAPIFFGGINVYLEQKLSWFRHSPLWLDRWLNAPALLRTAARFAGMTNAKDLGELTISMLRGESGHQAKELDRLLDWLGRQPRPDVVCLSNSLLCGLARRLRETLRVPVVCTLQGEDSFLDALPEAYRRQAGALLAERAADVDLFIAVSRYFGDRMRPRLGLPADRVAVVHPGIVFAEARPAEASPQPPVLGYLARLNNTKGLGTLVDAFIQLKRWDRVKGLRLAVAGAQTAADTAPVRTLQDRLAGCGLADDVEFRPNLSTAEKWEFLRGLTVFSVPATYGEAFGMYVIEALATGVPVVQPRHGAFPELLELTGGGVLCPPDDPGALAAAIQELLLDPDRARRLGRQGRQVVQEKFTVEKMTETVENLLAGLTGRPT